MSNHCILFEALSYLAQTNATDTLHYIIEEGERILCQSVEEQNWRPPPRAGEQPSGRRFFFFDSANDGMNIIE